MHTASLKSEPETGGARRKPASSAALGITLFLAAFFAVIALSIAPALGQEEQEAMFRMAHLSPDTPDVDVYVDDEPASSELQEVSFGAVSPYLPLSAGTRNVKVYPAGDDPETSDPILQVDVDLEGENWYTLPAVGLVGDGSLEAKLYEDDNSPPSEGNAKLRVVHAIPDVGAATVGVKGGEDLFTLPGFSNASDYAEVPAGTYTLDVKPAGTDEAALSVPDVTLSAGDICTAFAVGQAADGSLTAILTPDGETGSAVGQNVAPPEDNGSIFLVPTVSAPLAPPLDVLDPPEPFIPPEPSISFVAPAVVPLPPASAPLLDVLDAPEPSIPPEPPISFVVSAVVLLPPVSAPPIDASEPLDPGPEFTPASVPEVAPELPASPVELPAPVGGSGIDEQPGLTAPVSRDVREPVQQAAVQAIPTTTPQPVFEPAVSPSVEVPDEKPLDGAATVVSNNVEVHGFGLDVLPGSDVVVHEDLSRQGDIPSSEVVGGAELDVHLGGNVESTKHKVNQVTQNIPDGGKGSGVSVPPVVAPPIPVVV